jgi:hypothetical protein
VRQHPPGAAGPDQVEDGVHQVPAGVLSGPAAGHRAGDEVLDVAPLQVGQVRRVALPCHAPEPTRRPPREEDRFLNTLLDLVAFFRSKAASQCKINWKTGINTKANLKSSVFQEIVASLGLDYSRFATKEKLIDEKLLKNRNSIAHGRYSLVGFEEYLELHDEMYGIMQDFYNQIENSAFLGSYRKPAPTVHGNQ